MPRTVVGQCQTSHGPHGSHGPDPCAGSAQQSMCDLSRAGSVRSDGTRISWMSQNLRAGALGGRWSGEQGPPDPRDPRDPRPVRDPRSALQTHDLRHAAPFGGARGGVWAKPVLDEPTLTTCRQAPSVVHSWHPSAPSEGSAGHPECATRADSRRPSCSGTHSSCRTGRRDG